MGLIGTFFNEDGSLTSVVTSPGMPEDHLARERARFRDAVLSSQRGGGEPRKLWGKCIPDGLSQDQFIEASKAVAEWESSEELPEDLVIRLFSLLKRSLNESNPGF